MTERIKIDIETKHEDAARLYYDLAASNKVSECLMLLRLVENKSHMVIWSGVLDMHTVHELLDIGQDAFIEMLKHLAEEEAKKAAPGGPDAIREALRKIGLTEAPRPDDDIPPTEEVNVRSNKEIATFAASWARSNLSPSPTLRRTFAVTFGGCSMAGPLRWSASCKEATRARFWLNWPTS